MDTLLRPHSSTPPATVTRLFSTRLACFYAFASATAASIFANSINPLRSGINLEESVRIFLLVATLGRIILGDVACFHLEVDILNANSWRRALRCSLLRKSLPNLASEAFMLLGMFSALVWASFDIKSGKNFAIAYAAALAANALFLLYYQDKLKMRDTATIYGRTQFDSLKSDLNFWSHNNLFCSVGALLALAILDQNSTGSSAASALFGANIIIDLLRTRHRYMS